mmetsp:Transcript_3643/g.6901  ORF Transcript_3643/g.6901 Transcript_3643/m.6901 type:complete len:234 (+) Transcript_3643:870-1571(+)
MLRTPSSSSTPPVPLVRPRESSTPPEVTPSTPCTPPRLPSTFGTMTSTPAWLTRGGSPVTLTFATARFSTERRRPSSRAPLSTPTRAATGTWSSASRSTSSTPPRLPFDPSCASATKVPRSTTSAPSASSDPSGSLSTLPPGTGTTTSSEGARRPSLTPTGKLRLAGTSPAISPASTSPRRDPAGAAPTGSTWASWTPRLARSRSEMTLTGSSSSRNPGQEWRALSSATTSAS